MHEAEQAVVEDEERRQECAADHADDAEACAGDQMRGMVITPATTFSIQ